MRVSSEKTLDSCLRGKDGAMRQRTQVILMRRAERSEQAFEQLHIDGLAGRDIAGRRRSTMKQFACDIDDRMPEPWSLVVRTVQPPSLPGARMPRWNSVRPGALRIGAASAALNIGSRRASRRPCSISSASRTNCVERHHHRDRIARQAEEMGVPMRR